MNRATELTTSPAPEVEPTAPLHWIVGNFKPITSLTAPIRPTTIVAGANSSGKSSLIQSLLLLTQSIAFGELALNGPLVSLGEPSDVIKDGETELLLGCRVEIAAGVRQETVDLRLTYTATGDKLELFAVDLDLGDRRVLDAELTDEHPGVSASQTRHEDEAPSGRVFQVRALGEKRVNRLFLESDGILPRAILLRQKASEARQQLDWLDRERLLRDRVTRERLARLVLGMGRTGDVSSAWEAVASAASTARREGDERPFEEVLQTVNLGPIREDLIRRLAWVSEPLSERSPDRELHAGHSGIAELAVIDPEAVLALEYLASAVDALRRLAKQVVYLGPLREAPELVSRMGEGARNAPVGTRGEYTADFLARRAEAQTLFVDPSGKARTATLAAAVSDWVGYLGVGDAVSVVNQGKLGRSLHLSLDGADRDLTAVGVGASQVLPVISLVLGAPRRSVVLLEQPELHLHPAVQSRLADLLVRARPDLRVVIETHSESLVSRIRRRVAEGEVSPQQVCVMFAERGEDGSSFRELQVGAYGDLSDWPEGFFDANDSDLRAIVAAAAAADRTR